MQKNNGNGQKKKFLFVSIDALISDIAWQVLKEGHEVKYFIEDPTEKEVADGFVPKVTDWEKEVSWADIIVFDDVLGHGKKAAKLRKEGKLVIGGTAYTDKLEDDRQFGQEELKKHGIGTMPSWNFNNFDDAVEFVRANPSKYVIKPSGEVQNIKNMLFVGEQEDGHDVIQVLEAYKKAWKKAMIFQLQKRVVGVEVAVGAFFNGNEFVYPINVNFEHKKLFPGNIGPSTGEMGTLTFWSGPNRLFNATIKKMEETLKEEHYVGYFDLNCIVNSNGIYPLEFTCFDERTEILTQDGWKIYRDIKVGDFTLSINPATRELMWKRIVNKFVKDYNGKMIKIGSKGKAHSAADVLVTPEHKLLISNLGNLKFATAGSIPLHNTKLIRTGLFHCIKEAYIEIPAYAEKHFLGKHHTAMDIIHPARKVETHAFMKFLGLFLAEGYLGSGQHIVGIAQSPKGARRKEIEQVLNEFGFGYTVQKNGVYQISSTQLCRFIVSLGLGKVKAGEKFIPHKFKEFAPEYLESLIHGFALGDGNWHKRTGQLTLATTSKKLADDLQEIIIKCSKIANIRVQRQKGTKSIDGYVRKNDIYILSMRKDKMDYSLDKRVIGEQYYKGKIWDVEVEDWHTLLVRRNGKPFFSGNCRFGYPTISIQQEGIINPIGEFLYELATGELKSFRTKSGFQIGVRIVVPPFPYDDRKIFDIHSKDAVILFKKPSMEGIHIEDVKLVDDEWLITGDTGVILIVVGTGSTMREAKKNVYNKIDNILIPNMYYRKDIGDRWSEDSDKLHNWGYLREI